LKIIKIKQKFLQRKINKKDHKEKKNLIKKHKFISRKIKTKKIRHKDYHHMRQKIDKAFFSKRFGNLTLLNLRNEIRDKGISELELHKKTRRKR